MEATVVRVTVHPNAGKDLLISLRPGQYEAWIRAKPMDGRANDAVVALLARSFGLPAGAVRLVKGHRHRVKVFSLRPS